MPVEHVPQLVRQNAGHLVGRLGPLEQPSREEHHPTRKGEGIGNIDIDDANLDIETTIGSQTGQHALHSLVRCRRAANLAKEEGLHPRCIRRSAVMGTFAAMRPDNQGAPA